jgi:hypothetical protein
LTGALPSHAIKHKHAAYSLVQPPFPSHFSHLYQELGISAERFDFARNLHRAIQKRPPDFFVGEFVYGWGNGYLGATVSNLDVTLRTLQAAAPRAKVIVVMQASEEAHIGKLPEYFAVHAVLKLPVSQEQMRAALQGLA